jgi:eukaryotic-like serine/threonine-protein kinase
VGETHPGADAAASDWHSVDRVFAEVLERPVAERAAFLDRRCGGNAALRAAVVGLLEAERQSATLFAAAEVERAALLRETFAEEDDAARTTARIGERIGPWRLTALLGEGGMASVYLAERADDQWQQQVAIKLLRAPSGATPDAARLIAERQILSSLEHPNIARLLDGGSTADGQPYLVTEHVRGAPITRYCDERQLDVEARLGLFVQVANAVHHAHQKLVVHRDLKPSNIFVDEDGRVRLLDFGIAKLLEPQAMPGAAFATRTGLRPMTPEYAAPEQLAGAAVTTATDIYQLGLLLHELLTGARPGRAAPGVAAAEIGGTVPRPSTQVRRSGEAAVAGRMPGDARRLERRLRGDLDIILQVALREDPARRYASAAAMALDVQQHLQGNAIAARADSAWYLLKRFARRSPLTAVGAALLVVVSISWATSLQVYSLRLAEQRDAATREATRATRVQALLLDLFRQGDPFEQDTLGGRQLTVWESLDGATLRMRDRLADEPELLVELLTTVASLQERAGRFAAARDLLLQVVELERARGGAPTPRLVAALGNLGGAERLLSNTDAARAYLEEAVALLPRLPPTAAATVATVLLDAAQFEQFFGSPQVAEGQFRQVLATLDEQGGGDLGLRIDALEGLAATLSQLGRYREAEDQLRAALDLVERDYGASHSRVVPVLTALGIALDGQDRLDAAVAAHRRALQVAQEHLGDEHWNTLSIRSNVSVALGRAGDRAGEQAELRKLLELRLRLHGANHNEVGVAYQNLAASLAKTGQYDEALALLEQARRTFEMALPGNYVRAFPQLTEALVHLLRDDPRRAAAAAGAAHAVLSEALPPGHYAASAAECLLGEARLALGERDSAAPLLVAGAAALASLDPADVYRQRCEAAAALL